MPPTPLIIGVLILFTTLKTDQRNLTPGFFTILNCHICKAEEQFISDKDARYEQQEHINLFHPRTRITLQESSHPTPHEYHDVSNPFSRKRLWIVIMDADYPG